MGLKIKCDYCKKNMDVSASRCPHCHGEYTEAQIAKRKKEANQAGAIGCISILAIAGLIAVFSGGDDGPTKPNSADVVAPKAGSATPEVEAKVLSFVREIGTAISSCDKGSSEIAEITGKMQGGDASIYEGFSVIKSVEQACEKGHAKVNAIKPPSGLTEAAVTEAESAIKVCADAMYAKQQVAVVMTEILDGEARPSKVHEMKESIASAQTAGLLCVSGLMSVATATGVDFAKVSDALQ